MVDGALKDKKRGDPKEDDHSLQKTSSASLETVSQNVLSVPFKNIAQKTRVGRPEQLLSFYLSRSLYLTLSSSPLSSDSSPRRVRSCGSF